ncbi:MAG: hypothetical protein F7C34_03395 [Desulfurococcales archaeon]|nr:hypothetical protein [Desulfurococcales archaeon]
MRRGITILSDVVMIVALLLIMSGLWIYTATFYKEKRTLESVAAEEILTLYGTIEQVLSDPGMCTSTSLSIPPGIRIYVANIEADGRTGTLLIAKPSGARIELGAVRNLLISLGAPREDAYLIYSGGVLQGAGLVVWNTSVRGLEPVDASISGGTLDLGGVNWGGSDTLLYYNYKDTIVRVCSRWDNNARSTVLVLPQD